MEHNKHTGYPSIDKPWLKYYSEKLIRSNTPQVSAYEYLKFCNKDNMDGIAIRYHQRVMTYSELISQIDATASSLAGLGVKEQETVVAIVPALPEEVILLYAVDKIGACISYLMPGASIDVISATMEEFKATTLFVYAPFFTGGGNSSHPLLIEEPRETSFVLAPWFI